MSKYLPADQLRHLMWQSGEPVPPRVPPTPPRGSALPSDVQYILMGKTSRYAEGLHALRNTCDADSMCPHPTFVLDDGSNIYRPLTFRETIEARVNSYEQNKPREERLVLFKRWNDSCTAAAYKQGTTAFTLVPISKDLIILAEDFNEGYLPVPYSSLEGKGVELDSTADVYNTALDRDKIPDHRGWRAALEDDIILLTTYRDIVFEELKERSKTKTMPEKAMGFWIRQNTPTDELRALFVYNLDGNSSANGNYYLSDFGSFVRLAPSQKISP